MWDKLKVGGLPEAVFLKEIETLLRVGWADEAASRLKTLLQDRCGPDRPLPSRFLTIQPADIELQGWHDLPHRIAEYDKRGKTITAIGIDFSWPGHRGLKPDETDCLDPLIETNYYTDDPFPFSTADRAGLFKGYTGFRHAWQGRFEEIDDTIAIKGIGDLYGALFVPATDRPAFTTVHQIAHVIGCCYVVALVHLAIRDVAPRHVLPRPMAVIVGSNQEFPFFNAAVYAAR